MRRRLFNLASVVSLLLCLATVGLWVRSYWRADYLYYSKQGPHADWAYGLLLRDGTVQFDRQTDLRRDYEWTFEGLHSGRSGRWDWGEVNKTTDQGEFFLQFVGFTVPTGHWLLFGWNEDVRPFSGVWSGNRPPDGVSRSIFFPIWLITCSLLLAPSLNGFRLLVRVRRRQTNRCGGCGYSLTGNTSGVCPECGMARAEKAAT